MVRFMLKSSYFLKISWIIFLLGFFVVVLNLKDCLETLCYRIVQISWIVIHYTIMNFIKFDEVFIYMVIIIR